MKGLKKGRFVIRVYGLVINKKAQILLSDEYAFDQKVTKFPGGGLIYGEGAEDCIKREAIEEFGQEIEIIEHFYTTGFYQKAMFFRNVQLISIYYKIKFKAMPKFKISDVPFDYTENINGSQSFRWASIREFDTKELSFPIDRVVMELLKKEYS